MGHLQELETERVGGSLLAKSRVLRSREILSSEPGDGSDVILLLKNAIRL
jgi:hypothetical protein